jgi:hypothetical protein
MLTIGALSENESEFKPDRSPQNGYFDHNAFRQLSPNCENGVYEEPDGACRGHDKGMCLE